MGSEMHLSIAEADADAERLEQLVTQLRAELLELDVESVAVERQGSPPPGARAIDPAVVTGLLVGLGRSAAGLRPVVRLLRQWLDRGDGASRAVRIEIGGDVLQISNARPESEDRLVELLIRKHLPAADGP